MEKHNIFDLAIFGGPKAFDAPLYVGVPNDIDQVKFFSRVKEALDQKQLTNNGPFVREFEQKISEFLGVGHCIAVSSGTAGLEIAIRAAEMTGEVIVPSFTYAATPHALLANNLVPVFCDIDPQTYNMQSSHVEALISPRTKGILGVHLWGRPCDINSLTAIAARHQLKLVFDAAHAFGCNYLNRKIGNFGDMEVFSFHATKYINTVEGGAIATNNAEYARKARQIRNFGFSSDGKSVSYGTNAKMNEISAAMGLTMFENLATLISHIRANYHLYHQFLAGIPGLKMIKYPDREDQNYQFIVLEIDPDEAGISRDELLSVLETENIAARRYFYPGSHRLQPYADDPKIKKTGLPVTEQMCSRLMVIPTGTSINEEKIKVISRIIRLIVTQAQAIRTQIQASTHRALLQEQ